MLFFAPCCAVLCGVVGWVAAEWCLVSREKGERAWLLTRWGPGDPFSLSRRAIREEGRGEGVRNGCFWRGEAVGLCFGKESLFVPAAVCYRQAQRVVPTAECPVCVREDAVRCAGFASECGVHAGRETANAGALTPKKEEARAGAAARARRRLGKGLPNSWCE